MNRHDIRFFFDMTVGALIGTALLTLAVSLTAIAITAALAG